MSLDPEIKDLFQHLFGDMDMFDHLIFTEILILDCLADENGSDGYDGLELNLEETIVEDAAHEPGEDILVNLCLRMV